MKTLCSTTLDGRELEYLLDIGRRSNAYLSVKDGVLTVRLPYGGTPQRAEALIIEHSEWLKEKLESSKDRSRLPEEFSDGESFSLLGTKRQLRIAESDEYREPLLTDDSLTIFIHEGMGAEDVRRLFRRFVYSLCEERVRLSFDKYTAKLGLYPKRVTFKKMVSRWGSCSVSGNISINVDVICFEQECIDYVVIHELCHLKHMDHGADFWALVSTCCPDYKRLRERMKH